MNVLLFFLLVAVIFVWWVLTPVACVCPECREDVHPRASACPSCHRAIKPAKKWLSWLTKNVARLGIILVVIYLLNPENRAAVVNTLVNIKQKLGGGTSSDTTPK